MPLSPDTKESCVREVEVEIPADVVVRETEAIVEKFRAAARLPGFRKGKVPGSIIRNRFADEVRNEVVDALVPRYFREEVKKRGLEPVSSPRVTDLSVNDGEPLRFKASFEVLPEIELGAYQELRADNPDVAVSDQDVEQALEHLREQHATYSPIEGRGLADGDWAQVSFRGAPKDGSSPEAKPVSVDEVMVEIGGANSVPEFNENLRGAQEGEERSFDVAYPAEFSDPRLAGQTFHYTVQVRGIKKKELPELDDAFARTLGEFPTLDDLRKKIREQLEAERRHEAEHEAKEKLIDELIRRHHFPVPEALVERQVELRLERGLRALAAQGMRTEDMRRMDFDRLRAGQRESAVREVKASLLLDRIAERENVEVTEQEVDAEVEALARQMRQTPEAIRARLTREGALDRIRNRIRHEKTLDLLYRRSA
ncbi:MAG TPA: trigger factor [Terriglobales bacterium]|nr:trigger factor [Terriglobales bacterium]